MRLAAALTAALSTTLAAQSGPQFDVAAIRPSAEQTANGGIAAAVHITGSQMRITGLTLKDYVALAYGVRAPQIIAPDWASQERFDISANLPDGGTPDQIPAMVKDLLATRFQLKAHTERRDFPVYALAVSRGGLRIKPATGGAPAPTPGAVNVQASGSAAGINLDLGGGTSFSLADNKIEAKNITLAQLADTLSRFTDRKVIDATNTAGRWDVTVDLTQEQYQSTLIRSAVNAGVVLPPQVVRFLDAAPANPLEGPLEQAGLAFESQKAPLDVVIVDSMSKTPTEN